MSKVVLITGGSSGIGKSIGEFLQEKGFKVYGTSRDPKKYPNSKFPIIALDVTKPETVSDPVAGESAKTDPKDEVAPASP